MRQWAGQGSCRIWAITLGLPISVLRVLCGGVLHEVLKALAVLLGLHAGVHRTLQATALVSLPSDLGVRV